MARAMTSYNLADLTATQAKERGRVVHEAWKAFHLNQMKKRLARTKPPVK